MEIIWFLFGLTWFPAGWYAGRSLLKGSRRWYGNPSTFIISFAFAGVIFGWLGFFMAMFMEPRGFFGEALWNWWIMREPRHWSFTNRLFLLREENDLR